MAEVSKEYKTITEIAGPLVFVEKTEPIGYRELVSVRLSDGTMKRGQVLDTSDDMVVVQIFEGTTGIDRDATVRFLGETMKMPVSKDMLGRILSGSGQPLVCRRTDGLHHLSHCQRALRRSVRAGKLCGAVAEGCG